MSNDIVWFDDSETGAPVLNNAAGSLDAILYACLVTGFNPKSGLSITVTSNVAYVTLAGHGYSDQKMVDIAGAGTGSINGRKLITVTGSGAFNFPAPGVADGAITGSITSKRSPLGWLRDLNSSNVSIYKRADVTATAMGLRIDDSGTGLATATSARVRMVETWGADVNTYTGPAPTDAQTSGGFHWLKGANTSGAKPWVLVGDSKTIYLLLEASGFPVSTYGVPQGLFVFGDIASYRAGDAYHCMLAGAQTATAISSSGPGFASGLGSSPATGQAVLSRPSNALSGSVTSGMVALAPSGGNRRLGGSGPSYPSPVDNGLTLCTPVYVSENVATFGYPLRGEMRGIGDPLHNMGNLNGSLHKRVLTGVTGSSRNWLILGYQHDGSYGAAAFDVTGPWA